MIVPEGLAISCFWIPSTNNPLLNTVRFLPFGLCIHHLCILPYKDQVSPPKADFVSFGQSGKGTLNGTHFNYNQNTFAFSITMCYQQSLRIHAPRARSATELLLSSVRMSIAESDIYMTDIETAGISSQTVGFIAKLCQTTDITRRTEGPASALYE